MLILAFLTIQQLSGVVTLPAGVTELDAPLMVPKGARALRITGSGTILRASARFRGGALIVARDATDLAIAGVSLEGNRKVVKGAEGFPPHDRTFAAFYSNNGILAERIDGLTISGVQVKEVAGFAVLVSASQRVLIEQVTVIDSGSLGKLKRNNSTGGILLEEGTKDFRVERCRLTKILGNGIWTHSNYESPRNGPGRIAGNEVRDVGRDAIQIGHATEVRVERNRGSGIGVPHAVVDIEGGGVPVAIDTAGDVDKSVYANNEFTEINGKCIDLDGFHDGDVTENVCSNAKGPESYPSGGYGIVFNNTNPDMQSVNIRVVGNRLTGVKFGGIFVIGWGHSIRDNILNVNTAKCNESHAKFGCIFDAKQPALLESGIYFGSRAERAAVTRWNVVRGNTISGHKMRERCIVFGPGVNRDANTVEDNTCRSTE